MIPNLANRGEKKNLSKRKDQFSRILTFPLYAGSSFSFCLCMDGPRQTIPGPRSKDGEFRGFIVVVYAPAGGMKILGLIAKDIVMFLDATTINPSRNASYF
jgi:hypothetical protein